MKVAVRRCVMGAIAVLTASMCFAQVTAIPMPAQTEQSVSEQSASDQTQIATKHARFTPVHWSEIPDWKNEDLMDGWRAFLVGCRALIHRPAWEGTCQHALSKTSRSLAEIRDFFESEFTPFKVTSPELDDTGLMTGYFEPLLDGSRTRTERYRYPVYATPADLLYVDARSLKGKAAAPQWARVEGMKVIPVGEAPLQGENVKLYRLDLKAAPADPRDRRIRARILGDRIVPYLTRQEIEQSAQIDARPIAWVDNADLLYLLHIQGSGRIRLPGGEIVRVGFAEQNGHPFLPKVVLRSSLQPRTRGSGSGVQAADEAETSAEVQRMVDYFLGQLDGKGRAAKESKPVAIAKPKREPPESKPFVVAKPKREVPRADKRPPVETEPSYPYDATLPDSPVFVSSTQDPSYVFFREIRVAAGGPPGALGVALTPGRSLAVDPRVTPLGSPVFVSALRRGGTFQTNKLMVAQDTGGAIRGAVRADYFWGFGKNAGAEAMRMKDELRMWVLLPRALDLSALASAVRTRGVGDDQAPDCLIADEELCAE